MYICKLKLWNFRKYGRVEDLSNLNLDAPHLSVEFNQGLNVLIGENDSGKSAILDAIKLVLKTHAYEWIRVEEKDFYSNKGEQATKLRIEIEFKGLADNEARHFIEWLGWYNSNKGEGQPDYKPLLRIIYEVERNKERILVSEVCAGMDDSGYPLNALAKDFLKTTYLKALRDADGELMARRNSRVSQILRGHSLFRESGDDIHEFKKITKLANDAITDWLEVDERKRVLKDTIDEFIKAFISNDYSSEFVLSNPNLVAILEKISVAIAENENLGLGTMNRLFMAIELLHLRKENDGLKLALIEELEAHLHPQAQMKVIEKLRTEKHAQFILTTHSPNISSKVPLDSLILCKKQNAFSMGKGTCLDAQNIKYLERFLDATKSNLFFAKGVIIVEGWSEEILLPALAKKMGIDLTQQEIAIVNVGSTAYLHFAKIFMRENQECIGIPVAVVTDLDNRPDSNGFFSDNEDVNKRKETLEKLNSNFSNSNIKLEVAKEWTLEWCLYKSSSLSRHFKESVQRVHSKTKEFKSDEHGNFNDLFENKFIAKLRKDSGTSSHKGTSPLDKLSIISTLAEKIENDKNAINFDGDEYIAYLINAINHVCGLC